MSVSILWRVLYWTWIGSETLVAAWTYTRRGGGAVRDRGSMLLLWIAIFGSISAGSAVGATHAPTMFGGADWLRTLSVVLMVLGLVIRWTAIVTLGRSFSVNVAIHATQTVKRTGIFRYARHPSYTGVLMIFVALGVHLRNWESLAILLVPTTAALLYRMYVEETALRQAFGADYEDYSRSTKRLIPGIY